jgi:hypothetical protein
MAVGAAINVDGGGLEAREAEEAGDMESSSLQG